ncbi:cytoskeletal protein RodZ [Actinoplanes campanulatus]|uniref:Cytoskeletal protein RodZ n=1 Tax=Actinoplanes campanulatus TaxID=113559 RepID=A0A7W5ANU6_9ACTN|nr:hypothetical protein [Actinoplanes campanulatus]MBB3099708.1 cytoskeletal protein RodZ [Actinoplanes campanulatus]GGN25595.1 hypothetical protein GCM10010109_41990 [Actinoplanes campanulatus]GID39390.1 hypothetical protein Aca09nite_58960 [Actinoplanes campanulatus]
MYAWIWRKLPGGGWSKLTMSLALVSVVGLLLWYVVFPWATPLLPFDDVQVEAGTGEDAGGTTVVPGDDELPYSTTSNQPQPSPSR